MPSPLGPASKFRKQTVELAKVLSHRGAAGHFLLQTSVARQGTQRAWLKEVQEPGDEHDEGGHGCERSARDCKHQHLFFRAG